MPTVYTPLRYPGGKTKFGGYLAELMRANRLVDGAYAEPYAGGAGAGLHLLFRGYASRLHLNDIDRGVASFWRAILGPNSEKFARQIDRVPLTVDEWDRQKAVLREGAMGFDLGFAFFYLNRTNRSGILNGGIIGGRAQTGAYLIDARFNREGLAARVRAVAALRRNISFTRLDAIEFLGEMNQSKERLLTYLDPPYFHAGRELYTSFYEPKDHARIAEALTNFQHPWVLTYDACDEVRALYRRHTVIDSELSYSAREVRRGEEVVIFGPSVRRPRVTTPRPTRYQPGFELKLGA